MSYPRPQFTYGLGELMRRLGQDRDHAGRERSPRWQAAYVTALIDSHGFPAPFPFIRGGRLIATVHRDSRWPVDAVDAWLDDWTPPGATSAAERDARNQAAAAMDQAAHDLAGQLGLRVITGGRA